MAEKISNKKYADTEEDKKEVNGLVEKDNSQELLEKKPKTIKKKVVNKSVEKKTVKKVVKKKEVDASETPEPVKPKRKYTRKNVEKTPSEINADKVIEKAKFVKEKLAKRERVLKEAILQNNVVYIEPIVLTLKDIYNQFILDDEPFKIYHKGSILFDSNLHIEMPIMTDEHIIVFGKNYIYRGIQFTKY